MHAHARTRTHVHTHVHTHTCRFPQLEVIACQFFGWSATSVTVARLLSVVGMSYANMRGHADMLEHLAFAELQRTVA